MKELETDDTVETGPICCVCRQPGPDLNYIVHFTRSNALKNRLANEDSSLGVQFSFYKAFKNRP